MDDTCVDPNSLCYIKMYDTGTEEGGVVEIEFDFCIYALQEDPRGRIRLLCLVSAEEDLTSAGSDRILIVLKRYVVHSHCMTKPGSKIDHAQQY